MGDWATEVPLVQRPWGSGGREQGEGGVVRVQWAGGRAVGTKVRKRTEAQSLGLLGHKNDWLFL